MRILALETATGRGSVALLEDDHILEREVDLRGDGAVEEVRRLLAEVGVGLDSLEAVAVSVGPGSFTGIRIGVAAAQGLCLARGLPAVAVGTLEGLAWGVLDTDWELDGTLLLPSVDARRNEVYAALYRARGPNRPPERLWGPDLVSALAIESKFAEILPQGARVEAAALCGDGASLLSELFSEPSGWSRPAALSRARAATIARAAVDKLERGELKKPDELEPVYIRKSDAEIRREDCRATR